ncbi:hypothetical protein BDR07DRAFT_1389563 [Suillus spraguei]|nr:hypothetical protein BDR07DRAFT_1389563 [Suillus spraguei]
MRLLLFLVLHAWIRARGLLGHRAFTAAVSLGIEWMSNPALQTTTSVSTFQSISASLDPILMDDLVYLACF